MFSLAAATDQMMWSLLTWHQNSNQIKALDSFLADKHYQRNFDAFEPKKNWSGLI